MSEIKGTLLAIILAVSVFAVVFPLIMTAIKNNTDTVAGRIKDSVEREPDYTSSVTKNYSLHY